MADLNITTTYEGEHATDYVSKLIFAPKSIDKYFTVHENVVSKLFLKQFDTSLKIKNFDHEWNPQTEQDSITERVLEPTMKSIQKEYKILDWLQTPEGKAMGKEFLTKNMPEVVGKFIDNNTQKALKVMDKVIWIGDTAATSGIYLDTTYRMFNGIYTQAAADNTVINANTGSATKGTPFPKEDIIEIIEKMIAAIPNDVYYNKKDGGLTIGLSFTDHRNAAMAISAMYSHSNFNGAQLPATIWGGVQIDPIAIEDGTAILFHNEALHAGTNLKNELQFVQMLDFRPMGRQFIGYNSAFSYDVNYNYGAEIVIYE